MFHLRRAHRWWLFAGIALGLLSALYLYPLVLNPQLIMFPASNLGTDLLTQRWPDATTFVQAVRDTHQFPLWDPSIMGGYPTVGNPAIIEYYPFWALFLLFPRAVAFNIIYVAHVWLGGIGMLLLLRVGYHTSRTAALLGAITLMLAPKLAGHLAAGHIDMTFPIFWLPWSLLCVMLALERKQAYWAALAGLPLMFAYLLHVQSFFFDVFFVGVYLLWRLVRDWQGWSQALNQSLLSAMVPISLIVLSAAQLLPWLTIFPHATRQQWSLADGSWWSLPPALLGGLLFNPRTQFPEWTMYLGVLPILLCLVALLRPRSKDVYFLVGFLVFSILFSLGLSTPVWPIMFYVPGFGLLRVPPRMMFVAAAVVATLVGLGWDSLHDAQLYPRLRRFLPLSTWIYIVLTVFLIGGYVVLFKTVPWHIIRALGLLGAGIALLWIVVRYSLSSFRVRIWVTTAALILLIADLLPTAWSFMSPVSENIAIPPSVTLDYVRAQGGFYRAYSPDAQFSYELAPEKQVQLIDGVRSLQLAPMAKLVRVASGCDFEGFSAGMPPCAGGEAGPDAARKATPDPKLLGLLNIRWMAVKFPIEAPGLTLTRQFDDVYLYENPQALPRAFVAGNVVVAKNEDEAIVQLAAGTPRDTVVVTNSEPLAGHSADATITEYTDNRIVIDTTITAPGMLVLSDSWLEGWQATDNGLPVAIERVDVALRGIRLTSSGTHHIVMDYEPPAVFLGLLITLAGLGFLLLWTGFRVLRQRREAA